MKIRVSVRNADLRRAWPVHFMSLRTVERLHGVGEWALELPAGHPSVDLFRAPDAGIDVRVEGGGVIFSGPVGAIIDRVERGERKVTIAGADDNVRLAERTGAPNPTVADPASWTSAHDVHTGQLSTVLLDLVAAQMGPAPTGLAERAVPQLVLADDPLVGPTVTVSARLGTVLEQIAKACAGTDVVAVLHQEGDDLVFRVREAVIRPEVLFAPEMGTLEWSYEQRAPKATTVYVAGAGELETRLIRRVDATPDPQWPRRIEAVYDQRSEDDPAVLVSAGESFLAENGPQQSLRLEGSSLRWEYRRDFDLGDRVSAKVDQRVFVEQVTTVEVTYQGSKPPRTAVTIGPEQWRGPTGGPLRQARRLSNRISNVEAS